MKRLSFTYDYTVSANGYLDITGTNLNMVAPNGYTMLAVLRASAQKTNVNVVTIFPQAGNHMSVRIYNDNSSSQSGTFRLDVAFMLAGCVLTS